MLHVGRVHHRVLVQGTPTPTCSARTSGSDSPVRPTPILRQPTPFYRNFTASQRSFPRQTIPPCQAAQRHFPATHRPCSPWHRAGVAATLHADTSDSTYVQLHGRKEFILLPPAAARSVHMYPAAHPNSGQVSARTACAANIHRVAAKWPQSPRDLVKWKQASAAQPAQQMRTVIQQSGRNHLGTWLNAGQARAHPGLSLAELAADFPDGLRALERSALGWDTACHRAVFSPSFPVFSPSFPVFSPSSLAGRILLRSFTVL